MAAKDESYEVFNHDSRSTKGDSHENSHESLTHDSSCEEQEKMSKYMDLPENVFGFVLMSTFVDWHDVGNQKRDTTPRVIRMIVANFLLIGNFALQLFVLAQVKKYVTYPVIDHIRDQYNKFEVATYDEVYAIAGANFLRGVPGTFDQTKFDRMSDKFKDEVCSIPLAHPRFLSAVLLIWTLTIVVELRVIVREVQAFIERLKTTESLSKCIRIDQRTGYHVIIGLPYHFKAWSLFYIYVPRIIITFLLLWLGCRWLAATTEFAEVVINAVALEFLLCTKDLLFQVGISDRSKRDVADCKVHIDQPYPVTTWTYTAGLGYLALSLFWTWYYIHHGQHVIPHYQYDVAEPCSEFVANKYKISFT